MADERHLELLLVRYVPRLTAIESVNIGLVLLELSGSGSSIVDVRFTSDWRQVLSLDPRADIHLLRAIASDICTRLTNGRVHEVMRQMDDSFSNAIQLSPCPEYPSNEHENNLESLVEKYL